MKPLQIEINPKEFIKTACNQLSIENILQFFDEADLYEYLCNKDFFNNQYNLESLLDKIGTYEILKSLATTYVEIENESYLNDTYISCMIDAKNENTK